MAKIQAPFTPEQVEGLNRWQHTGWVHPFTCANRDTGHSMDDVLVATEAGWMCLRCDYTQQWAHDFMAEGWPNPLLHDHA